MAAHLRLLHRARGGHFGATGGYPSLVAAYLALHNVGDHRPFRALNHTCQAVSNEARLLGRIRV